MKQKTHVNKVCELCNNEFMVVKKKKHQRFCGRKCSSAFAGSKSKPGNGGLRDGGGRSKTFEYESPIAGKIKLNKDEIEVAKVLDCLNLNWKRNTKGFSYVDLNNKERNYHPDFYINDFDCYVEYKGWVDDKLTHKMKDAQIKNDFKLLIIYSNNKRYRDLGLNLEQIMNNPKMILDYLK